MPLLHTSVEVERIGLAPSYALRGLLAVTFVPPSLRADALTDDAVGRARFSRIVVVDEAVMRLAERAKETLVRSSPAEQRVVAAALLPELAELDLVMHLQRAARLAANTAKDECAAVVVPVEDEGHRSYIERVRVDPAPRLLTRSAGLVETLMLLATTPLSGLPAGLVVESEARRQVGHDVQTMSVVG